MKRRIKSGIISMVSVSLLLSLASCEREREYATPAKPVEVTAALNYYLTRGLLDGTINGVLYENGGVIALPAGTWRIRYVVSGHWWQLVVRGQGPTCHYIGTYNPIEAVMVHQGTHSSLLAEGLLEPVTVTVSEWQPLPGTEELWVFQDGVLASGITPLDRQDFCPKIEPPTAGPICGGVLVEGFCWYLSPPSMPTARPPARCTA